MYINFDINFKYLKPRINFQYGRNFHIFGLPSDYTFEKKGSRKVKATTADGERTRLSAALTARADVKKLPICIVIPRTNALANYTPPENVIVHYRTAGTFNENIVCGYLDDAMTDKPQGY